MDTLLKQNLTGKKILLVDDNPVNIELLAQTLQSENLEIFTATNGKVGLEVTHKYTPDLILLDIAMPEMDGFEMCSEIVKNYTDFIETITDNQIKQIILETKPFIVMITAYQGEKFL